MPMSPSSGRSSRICGYAPVRPPRLLGLGVPGRASAHYFRDAALAADAGDEGQLREDPEALLVDPAVVHIRAVRVIAVLEVEHHERHIGGRDLLEALDDLLALGLIRGRLQLR